MDCVWPALVRPSRHNRMVCEPCGTGYLFCSDVVTRFHSTKDTDMIRAHHLVTGYEWHFSETVLTVQLSPNYCYNCGNVAAILELDKHLQEDFSIFEAIPEGHGASPSISQWLNTSCEPLGPCPFQALWPSDHYWICPLLQMEAGYSAPFKRALQGWGFSLDGLRASAPGSFSSHWNDEVSNNVFVFLFFLFCLFWDQNFEKKVLID